MLENIRPVRDESAIVIDDAKKSSQAFDRLWNRIFRDSGNFAGYGFDSGRGD